MKLYKQISPNKSRIKSCVFFPLYIRKQVEDWTFKHQLAYYTHIKRLDWF